MSAIQSRLYCEQMQGWSVGFRSSSKPFTGFDHSDYREGESVVEWMARRRREGIAKRNVDWEERQS